MLGIIGAGNMAGALARGWGEPVLATDRRLGSRGASRRGARRRSTDRAMPSSRVVPTRSSSGTSRISCTRSPRQIDARRQAGVLGARPDHDRGAARRRFRIRSSRGSCPTRRCELRQGVCCIAKGGEAAVPLFERVGRVFVLPESQMNLATATIGVTPAYIAVIVEAMVDAAAVNGLGAEARHGHVPADADRHVASHRSQGGDTLAVRREVESPGESTVRGVAALERCGIRPMMQEAMKDVLHRLSQPYLG